MPVRKPHGFCDLGFAKVDTDRLCRRGVAEVIYAPGKDRRQICAIIRTLRAHKQTILITKLDQGAAGYLKRFFPRLGYHPQARLGYLRSTPAAPARGMVAVVSAGTADMPVAEEAATTLKVLGSRVTRFYDVGVAGVHRLLQHIDQVRKAKVIIVVAGMEGALASVISGLVRIPVVAVPTSCGYGASFQGLAALLTMLNGCSPGVTVVNIDNGFGAGYVAHLINTA